VYRLRSLAGGSRFARFSSFSFFSITASERIRDRAASAAWGEIVGSQRGILSEIVDENGRPETDLEENHAELCLKTNLPATSFR
jgi:hypothetical protein